MSLPSTAPSTEATGSGRWVLDAVQLTKPRITSLVTLTGAAGYTMGSRQGIDPVGLVHTVIGIALVAAAANVLNQLFERVPDSKMKRTAGRPLPAGRIQPNQAATFGGILALLGISYCALLINPLTALLAFLTLAIYSFVYTPLKRVTPFNTLVGAVPGGLPPVGGWAAATGSLSGEAWVLFGIIFLWQIPHFLAIAWIFKEDYANAGFKMLPVVDVDGRRTAAHLILSSLALGVVSALPVVFGFAGAAYLLTAVTASVVYFLLSISLALRPGEFAARLVFYASLVYLPALFILMTADRMPLRL